MKTSAVLENTGERATASSTTKPARLRVAMLNRHFSRRSGGAEAYSIALVEGMAASPERFDVHVFAQQIEHQHPHVTYHKLPGPIHRPRWINQLLFATCAWWLTRRGFDVVHSHENTWHGQVQTVHVRPIRYNLLHEQKDAQGHTVAHTRTGLALALRWLKIITSPRLGAYVWLEAARMRPNKQKVVVAVSQSLKNQTLKAYPASDAAMPIITPGVTLPAVQANPTAAQAQARAALGLPQQVPLLLFVGNDYARKGLPTLLQALALLNGTVGSPSTSAQPDPAATTTQQDTLAVHLAVIGKSHHAEFERQAADLGIAAQVHFLGSLQGAQAMAQAYQAADALAHPTLEDSYAMVVQEALSHGLPAVVSDATYCGIAAHLQHAHNALILPKPRDAKALASLIKQALFDPKLRQHLREQGLAFARAHSTEQTLAAYLAIYEQVSLASPHRRSSEVVKTQAQKSPTE